MKRQRTNAAENVSRNSPMMCLPSMPAVPAPKIPGGGCLNAAACHLVNMYEQIGAANRAEPNRYAIQKELMADT